MPLDRYDDAVTSSLSQPPTDEERSLATKMRIADLERERDRALRVVSYLLMRLEQGAVWIAGPNLLLYNPAEIKRASAKDELIVAYGGISKAGRRT